MSATYDALLLGHDARKVAHWPSTISASGMPMFCTAVIAATAKGSAWGEALPMSSDAKITILLAMNTGSSPASIILAR